MNGRKLFFLVVCAVIVVWIVEEVVSDYDYDNQIGSFWALGIKASTLQQKTTYLDQYVNALQGAKLEGTNNASFLKTPDNSFDQNMIALKSLQGRMHQIQGMDEQSFAYQTAMQQITGQEQGQAGQLTETFRGCWFLRYYWLLWGWHDIVAWILMIVFLIISGVMAFND
jgi:hypothetical protein